MTSKLKKPRAPNCPAKPTMPSKTRAETDSYELYDSEGNSLHNIIQFFEKKGVDPKKVTYQYECFVWDVQVPNEEYEDELIEYRSAMVKYQEKMARYEIEKKAYDEKMAAWQKENAELLFKQVEEAIKQKEKMIEKFKKRISVEENKELVKLRDQLEQYKVMAEMK